MAKHTIMTDAKDTMVEAAKSGAEGMKSVAGEALGAAAVAAAGVVLDHVSKALSQGAQDVEANKPAMTQAASDAVNFANPAPARKTAKKKSAKKAAKKQAAAAAPAKKSAKKKSAKKSVKKAAAKKKSAAQKSSPKKATKKSAKKSSAKKAAPKKKSGAKRKAKK